MSTIKWQIFALWNKIIGQFTTNTFFNYFKKIIMYYFSKSATNTPHSVIPKFVLSTITNQEW